MHLANRRARWPLLACLGLTALVAACDNDRGVTEPDAQNPRRSTMEYDYTDTWMAVDIDMRTESSITTDQAFTDPRTGQQTYTLNVTSPIEDIALDGGYSAYGDFVGELVHPLDADVEPGARVARTKFEWGTSVNYDEYGNQMSNVLPDGSTIPQITADDYIPPEGEPLTSGVVVDEFADFEDTSGGGGPGCGTRLVCEDQYMTFRSAGASVKRRVVRTDASTVQVIDDIEEDGAATAAGVRASNEAAPGKSKATRTYKQRNGKFVLSEVRLEREEVRPGARARHVQTLRYKRVSWHRNPAKDRQRAERAKAKQASVRTAPAPEAPSMMRAAAASAAPIMSLHPAPQGPAMSASSMNGTRIVLQHGFAQGWSYYGNSPARTNINNMLLVEAPLVTESDYGARFQDQAGASTIPQMLNRWGNSANAIMVGHSNGGIVSRQVAQWRPDMVRGVVTVSSPHRGVNVLRYRDEAAGLYNGVMGKLLGPVYATASIGCRWFNINLLCQFTNPDRVFSRLVGGDGRPVPVWDQETPENGKDQYLKDLNNLPESFPRVGIEQHTRQRWLMFRVFGDQRLYCTGDPGDSWYGHPCGRESVASMERTYGHLRSLTAVKWTWNPLKFAARVATAAAAGVGMLGLNAVDGTFNVLVGGVDRSDGLVQFGSQRYPNQSGNPVVVRAEDRADSHNWSAYSPPAVNALVGTLRGPLFNVPPR